MLRWQGPKSPEFQPSGTPSARREVYTRTHTDTCLVRILAGPVKGVWDRQLRVQSTAQHQQQEGKLAGRERLGDG